MKEAIEIAVCIAILIGWMFYQHWFWSKGFWK